MALRHLRIEAQKRRWSRDESKFFAEEQRLERALTPWFSSRAVEKGLSFGYDLASCYGASVSRALFSFVAWNVAFGGLFRYVLSQPCHASWAVVKGDSAMTDFPWLALMMQSAINPLALFSERPLVMIANGGLLSAALVQTVGSLSLLALFLLALRGRFQRGGGGGSVSAG